MDVPDSTDPIHDVLSKILAAEGWPVFTDHPHDRGGPTKGGITLFTLGDWRGDPSVTTDDLLTLSKEEALSIYRQLYVEGPGLHQIEDPRLLHLAVDCSVLHGQHRAVRWLQEAVEATVDGVFGPKTLTAIQSANPHRIALSVCAIRWRYMGSIVTGDPRQARWAKGWSNRMSGFLDEEAGRVSLDEEAGRVRGSRGAQR